MSKTKNNHYVSRWLSRNFKKDGALYCLDCKTKTIERKSEKNLFAIRRLWDQELEDLVSKEFDTKYAPVINSVRKMPFNSVTGDAVSLHKIEDCKIEKALNEFMAKQMFISKTAISGIPVDMLSQVLRITQQNPYKVFVAIINKQVSDCMPFVLADNPLFLDIAITDREQMIYNLCFMFPISERELLIFAKSTDSLECVLRGYHSIHEMNVHMIAQNAVECQVASGNLRYLEMLAEDLELIRKYRKDKNFTIQNIRDGNKKGKSNMKNEEEQ